MRYTFGAGVLVVQEPQQSQLGRVAQCAENFATIVTPIRRLRECVLGGEQRGESGLSGPVNCEWSRRTALVGLALAKEESVGDGQLVLGAYKITATPARQTRAPPTSHRSGRNPSAILPMRVIRRRRLRRRRRGRCRSAGRAAMWRRTHRDRGRSRQRRVQIQP